VRIGTHITLLCTLFSASALHARSADTSFSVCGAVVSLLLPEKSARGTILILPGWNSRQADCCDHSTFCRRALAAGFALVMPAMQKSNYVRNHFPETRPDWRSAPTLLWLVDTLIPVLQRSHGLLLPHQPNFLFGISTGGRGSALCAEATGSLFRAAAMLSGDFNPLMDTRDLLMIGYFGAFEKFPARWSGIDSPTSMAHSLEIPVYLGHGRNDHVVPVQQSIAFFKTLQAIHPEQQSVLHIDTTAGHDHRYWETESENVLNFFLNHCAVTKEEQR
jgi:pimeloyl-ACP methyl ester carboxylesterase